MENIAKESRTTPHATIPGSEPAAAPLATDTGAFDALATAIAEQGLFGKIKLGASLLLFGEVNLDKSGTHH